MCEGGEREETLSKLRTLERGRGQIQEVRAGSDRFGEVELGEDVEVFMRYSSRVLGRRGCPRWMKGGAESCFDRAGEGRSICM